MEVNHRTFSSYTAQRRDIAICGWYGDLNTGNEAILSGIVSSLKKVMPNIEIVVFSWRPKLASKQHGIKAYPYYKLPQILPKVGALIVGGGTLLTDWRLTLPLFLFLLGIIGWAKMLGKPVMLYAVGAEPFSTRLGKFLTRFIVDRVDLITVRGSRSKKVLKLAGIVKPSIYVTADPALNLQPLKPDAAIRMLARKGITKDRLLAVICLRRWAGSDGESSRLKQILAEACDYLVDHFHADVIFLPMSTSTYDDDRRMAVEIMKMVKNNGRIKLIMKKCSPEEAMAITGQSDLVISMRLHSLIFAAAMHVPMIALIGAISSFVPPSDNKILEFLEMIDQETLTCNYKNMRSADLLNKINEAMLAKKRTKYKLNSKVKTLQSACYYNAKLARELVYSNNNHERSSWHTKRQQKRL